VLGEATTAAIRGARAERFEDGLPPPPGRIGEAVHLDGYEQFVAQVRAAIDAALEPWLVARVSDARSRGADVGAVAETVRELVVRGGKRMRGVLLAAAYEGCAGVGGIGAVLDAAIALELLQAYLLVHDDWMDGDQLRRGGPSVPAMMLALFAPDRADAASILAGDLAAAWSRRALLQLPLPADRVMSAAREMARVEEEVVQGQVLDVFGRARDAADVERMHALKTASYSVRCPVVMGARLAGASEARVGMMVAFAQPLGVAFQLRDDVLGTFGDSGAMGKPAGSDLRKGKRTALVVDALRDGRAAEVLQRVLGRADASDGEVQAAVESIDACGARARVERRIAALVAESRAALDRVELEPNGRALLARAVVALTERER